MRKLLSLVHSLEAVAAVIAGATICGNLYSFIVGKHFFMPALIPGLAGNMRGEMPCSGNSTTGPGPGESSRCYGIATESND